MAVILVAALYEIVKTLKEVHLRRYARIPKSTRGAKQWINYSGDTETGSVEEKSPLVGNWSR